MNIPFVLRGATRTFLLAVTGAAWIAHAGTVTGTLQGPSGLPVRNATLSFTLAQAGLLAGSGVEVPLTVNCYTSADGSVTGLPDPLESPSPAIDYGSGALPGGTYYVELTYYNASQETLPSPERQLQLTGPGTLTIPAPLDLPPNAVGMKVYIGNTSGGEELQGETSGSAQPFRQAAALTGGAAPPAVNTSVCSIAFNDTVIPYSGYNVTLTSADGNAYPGWPQAWQLNGGTNGTVNIAQGTPLWNGTVIYPQPILAQPLNHGPQSIAGSLNMSGYDLAGVAALGMGTSTPSWPVDVENGEINSSGGYLYEGAAPLNHVLVGNGTAYVDSATIPASAISGLLLKYQTLQSDGAGQQQEPAENFAPTFALTDTAGVSTNIDLAPSGVTAGVYTNAKITVNAKGQVTAAADGSNTGTDDYFSFTGCTITNGSNLDNCSGTVTFTSGGNTTPSFPAMQDATYYPFCTVNTGNSYTASFSLTGTLTPTGFSYYWTEIEANSSPSSTPTIYCHLHHN